MKLAEATTDNALTFGARLLRVLQYGLIGIGCSMLSRNANTILHNKIGQGLALQATGPDLVVR